MIEETKPLDKKKIILSILSLILLIGIGSLIFIANKVNQQNKAVNSKADDICILCENFDGPLIGWNISDSNVLRQSSTYSRSPQNSFVINAIADTNAAAIYRLNNAMGMSKVSIAFYDKNDPAESATEYGYFALTNENESAGVSLGIKPDVSRDNYTYCPQHTNLNACLDSGIKRSSGWHTFKIYVTPKGSYGLFDNQNLSNLPGRNVNNQIISAVNTDLTSFQKIKLGATGSGFMRVYFDDLSIYPFGSAPNSEVEIIDSILSWFKTTYGGNISEQSIRNLFIYYDQQYQAEQANCQLPEPRSLNKPCPIVDDYIRYRKILTNALSDTAGNLRALGMNDKADIYERALASLPVSTVTSSQSSKNDAPLSVQASESYLVPNAAAKKNVLGATTECDRSNVGFFKPASDWKNYSSGTVISGFIANGWAEENAGVIVDRLLPAYMDCMSKDKTPENEKVAADLLIQLKLFAFHSLTRNESTPQITSPLTTYPAFTSQTIYNGSPDPKRPGETNTNFMLDNHLFHPDPTYALVVPKYLSTAAFEFREKYGYVPDEFQHNVVNVYKKALEYINIKDLQYKGNKISMRHEDVNLNQLSEAGPLALPQGDADPNFRYDYDTDNRYGLDESKWPNIYKETGKGDWKDDALLNRISLYAMMSKLYGINEVTDVDNGFTTNNFTKHILEYIYYTHNGYLFAPHNPIESLTKEDMLVPGGTPDNHKVYTNTVIYSIVRNNVYVGDLLFAKRILQSRTGLTGEPANTAPQAPTISNLPSCINSNATGNIALLTWPTQGNAVTYVDVSGNTNFDPFSNKFIAGTTQTYIPQGFSNLTSLQPNTIYYVRTWNGSKQSDAATFRIPACPTATQAVTPTRLPTITPTRIPTLSPTPYGIGSSLITINAASTLASGKGSNVDLRINGKTVKSFNNIGTNVSKLSYTHPTKVLASQLTVVFTNDVWTDHDRNVRIDSAIIDNVTYSPTSRTTYFNKCGNKGYGASTGWLNCQNDSFSFGQQVATPTPTRVLPTPTSTNICSSANCDLIRNNRTCTTQDYLRCIRGSTKIAPTKPAGKI